MQEQNLIPFEGKSIRKVLHNEEWYFSVIDVIEGLIESPNPSNYWNMLKKRENELYTVCVKLKFKATDSKCVQRIALIQKVFYVLSCLFLRQKPSR